VLALGPDADDRRVIAKLARRPGAAAGLRRQTEVLEHLLELPDAGMLRPLLPVPFVRGDLRGHTYLVERALPGRVMLALMSQPAARSRACSAALEAIHLLHRETARQVMVDEAHLSHWILQPLDALRTMVGLDQPLARLGQELCRAVCGRSLRVSWIHGDFWPGNVLVSPEGTRLTGIVDWDLASADELPMHDMLNMLLSVQSWTEGRELGELVRAHLENLAAGHAPDRVPVSDLVWAWLGDDLSERTCLLLYWLRFVTTHLSNCPWRARDRRWMARNVGSVLGFV
jgi:aminoglycoside phosphotransferase (APT) family kinase protein